tara:strand:+ start:178 stop:726 length:549 start_codon:yes stop_codon:yes gene_type:complete
MIIVKSFTNITEALINLIGRVISWLLPIMALLVLAIVVMRYCFSIGSIAIQELVEYLHATIFMLGISYTLKHDAHVRVDIFYRSLQPYNKSLINLFGTIFFLLPLCSVIIYTSWNYVLASWWILERSEERSGIAFVYGLKSLLLIMPILLSLQGLVLAYREILIINEGLGDHPSDPVKDKDG